MNITVESDDDFTTTSYDSKGDTRSQKRSESRQTSIAYKDGPDHIELDVDMPDVDPAKLTVNLKGRRLTVSYDVERDEQHEEDGEKRTVKVQESLRKEVDLPMDVEPESADAVYRNGALHLKIKKRKGEPTGGEKVKVNLG